MPSISAPAPPTMLRERPPPELHTSAKYPVPAPAVISSGSAVERVTVARNIRSASPGRSPSHCENVWSSPCASSRRRVIDRRLARPRLRHPLVARDRDAQARSGARERHALGRPEREAQRIQLGPASHEELAVELERDEVPGHRHRLHADVGDEPPGRRAGSAEDVGAEVQPVRRARLAADAAAEAVRALEHDDIAVAQIPGRGEAGDAASDHDHVAHGLAAGGVVGQAAESIDSVRCLPCGNGDSPDPTPQEDLLQRRLTRARLALGALGMLVAVCAIGVGFTIWYWISYLRGPGTRRSRAARTSCA